MILDNIKTHRDIEITLTDEEAEILDRVSVPKLMKKGTELFQEGEECNRLIRILSGKVLLYKISYEGKEISLNILGGESIIGENSLFETSYYTYSAKVIEDAYVFTCSKEEMLILLNNPVVSLDLIEQLTKKLNAVTDQVANMAFYDIRGRLLRTFSKLLESNGVETKFGHKIDIKLSHQELANMVNASRVMVTNILNALKGEGIIEIKDKYIFVMDLDQLDVDEY